MVANGNSPDKDSSNEDRSKSDGKKKQRASSKLMDKILSVVKRIQSITKRGIHSVFYMSVAGFEYTGNGDTVRCKDCGLEVSNWTVDMIPFIIHSKRKPSCPFVCSKKAPSLSGILSPERIKILIIDPDYLSNKLFEVDLLQQIRIRTFSHWPHRTEPSTSQMIEAGFFNCNVGDRVICLYCNLICQQWTPHTDDPCEVHKTLSPNCIYVKAKLIRPSASLRITDNENTTGVMTENHSSTPDNLDRWKHEFVRLAVCSNYDEIPKRHASFATWPHENLPSVDDLVRAGFFYTGIKSIVTCFYCNGALQNWGPNDNPMIEHARWFPHCAYAKQLCGHELYRKIQESKQAQQKRARANVAKEKTSSGIISNNNVFTNTGQLFIPDESTLSRFVAAQLDLPISQRLLHQGFKLSIIKRCWEDQFRLKRDDFVSECDLYLACIILQKQIEHIDGKKENIVIPSIKMKQIREQNAQMPEQPPNPTRSISNTTNVDITTSSQSLINESTSESTATGNQGERETIQTTTSTTPDQNQSDDSNPSNPCVLCLTEEKRVACIPCGHLATCVPCGHSLRSCPICRREIQTFVRIYI